MGARLPLPRRAPGQVQALGLQAADQLGRCSRPLAGSGPAQRRDGRHVPGRVPQLPEDTSPQRVMTQRLWAALSEVQDPEMPVNLVDLGVIYAIHEADGVVEVDLTFTALGCPASAFIHDDVRERLLREPGLSEVRIPGVWRPRRTPARTP